MNTDEAEGERSQRKNATLVPAVPNMSRLTTASIEERRQKLASMFNNHAPVAKTLGARLYYNTEGNAVVEMPHNPGFDTAGGNVHGGIGALLLDTAMVLLPLWLYLEFDDGLILILVVYCRCSQRIMAPDRHAQRLLHAADCKDAPPR